MLINQFLITNKTQVSGKVITWFNNLYDVSQNNIDMLLNYVDLKIGHLELMSESELVNINQFATITIKHLPNLLTEFKKSLTIKNSIDLSSVVNSTSQDSYNPIDGIQDGDEMFDTAFSGRKSNIKSNSLCDNLSRYGWGLATIGVDRYVDDLLSLIKYIYYPVEQE